MTVCDISQTNCVNLFTLSTGEINFLLNPFSLFSQIQRNVNCFLFRIISTGDSDCGNIRERGEGVGVSMLYHRIARDSSFCNKLYPCAPIVRLVIFLYTLHKMTNILDLKKKCRLHKGNGKGGVRS